LSLKPTARAAGGQAFALRDPAAGAVARAIIAAETVRTARGARNIG
jgi:hypothetical protein